MCKWLTGRSIWISQRRATSEYSRQPPKRVERVNIPSAAEANRTQLFQQLRYTDQLFFFALSMHASHSHVTVQDRKVRPRMPQEPVLINKPKYYSLPFYLWLWKYDALPKTLSKRHKKKRMEGRCFPSQFVTS